MKQIRKRVTYANVMSSIAVFLVLGGGAAYAAKKIGSNEIKGNSITTGKIKKEAVVRGKIKKAAIDSSRLAESAVTTSKIANGAVTTNKVADDAITGEKVKESSLSEVPKASLAVTAESAQPSAFGQINTPGTIEEANSKNIVKAEKIGEGEYCVTANFNPRGGQVTTIFGGTGGTTAQLNLNTGNCPPPAVQVLTWTGGAAPAKSGLPFFIVLYR